MSKEPDEWIVARHSRDAQAELVTQFIRICGLLPTEFYASEIGTC
jgi:hypothetical protein